MYNFSTQRSMNIMQHNIGQDHKEMQERSLKSEAINNMTSNKLHDSITAQKMLNTRNASRNNSSLTESQQLSYWSPEHSTVYFC